MKTLAAHLRNYIVRGLITVIPVAVTFFVLRFLYVLIEDNVMGFVRARVGTSFPGMGIILLLITLYGLGLLASNFIGRQLLRLLDSVSDRLPFVRTIYQVGKQLSVTLSINRNSMVKKVVCLKHPLMGVWTPGLVMGEVTAKESGDRLLKVLVPIAPNPASGFLFLVRQEETCEPGWTVEEGVKYFVSDGILSPEICTLPVAGKKETP